MQQKQKYNGGYGTVRLYLSVPVNYYTFSMMSLKYILAKLYLSCCIYRHLKKLAEI